MDCQTLRVMLNSAMHLLQKRARWGKGGPISDLIRRYTSSMPTFHGGRIIILALLLAASAVSAQNKVLKLDGKGSYVELPPDIFKDLTQATVEVWAKWAEFNTFSRVFEFGAGYQSVSLFNHSTNSDLRFNIYPRFAKYDPSSMFTATARGLLRSNEWIHLATVSGPGGMKLYANGRLVAQHTNTTTFADIKTAQTNLLGRGLARVPGDRDFHGQLDEIRVWDHCRTLEQVRDNMFKRLTGKEEGLVHLWNFDDGTANDSAVGAQHGTMKGNARIGNADLDLALAAAPVPPPVAAPGTNPPASVVAAAVNTPAVVPVRESNTAAWWIAGALVALVALLGALLLMLRRSGIGTIKLLPDTAARLTGGPAASPAQVPPAAPEEIKERALAELTSFAKESLVQGLYSQRAALLAVHEQAQKELAELEARVVALHLPERIEVYQKRIAELERKLETRGDELHELTQATLQLFRQKLEEEKQKVKPPERFN